MNIEEIILKLPCWKNKLQITPLKAGNTTQQFIVKHEDSKFFVKIGKDDKLRQIKRFNEFTLSQGASELKISPEIFYMENNLIVLKFIE